MGSNFRGIEFSFLEGKSLLFWGNKGERNKEANAGYAQTKRGYAGSFTTFTVSAGWGRPRQSIFMRH